MELLANLRDVAAGPRTGLTEAARLEEIETLCLGIEGKRLLWRALASADGGLAGFDFEDLERRAEAQRDRLERFRLQVASTAFRASSAE